MLSAAAAISLAVLKISAPTLASEDEKAFATKTYTQCLLDRAEQLDDGISDATSIAVGIMPGCSSAFQAVREAFERGANPQLRSMIDERLTSGRQGIAVSSVLTVRAARIKAKAAAQP